MVITGEIEFRPMRADDLGLLHEWLQQPHVDRWWNERRTFDQVVEHYLPAIEDRDPTDHYLVFLKGRPVGMLQTYLVADYPEYAAMIGLLDQATAGADILIGEADLTGRGLGTMIIQQFVDEIVFSRPETTACVADPHGGNTASLRAFEKAGFRPVSTHIDPADGGEHVLMRRDR